MVLSGYKLTVPLWVHHQLPPSPLFITVYLRLTNSKASIIFYLKRYINDQLGTLIQDEDPLVDCQRWEAFQQLGIHIPLQKCTLPGPDTSPQTVFNLHRALRKAAESPPLHTLEPRSYPCYAPKLGNWRRHRCLHLTSKRNEKITALSAFFSRLLARGYPYSFLHTTFQQAFKRFSQPKPPDDLM